ncbi:Cancer-related nucleoside-triphosphatase [Frankliniella fusca]|uniref:Cancer-related nucleoside-triphosphatase n=1 Tax=Frankliniella fusca TaxID=407009 RepID=A0AAE1H8X1_9NEOP|nr:Cancer-related nucleoside-triphosphatase [Frankliniella fusca]
MMNPSAGSRAAAVQHIILTGPPGIGKTTIIKKVCSELQQKNIPIKGFYTTELREGGKRIGFDVVALSGETSSLARVGGGVGPRVGQYVVHLKSFESVALPIFQSPNNEGIIVIDEIGKMELLSKSFETATERAFSTSSTILGTIPIQKGKPIRLVELVRSHPSVRLMTVSELFYNNVLMNRTTCKFFSFLSSG